MIRKLPLGYCRKCEKNTPMKSRHYRIEGTTNIIWATSCYFCETVLKNKEDAKIVGWIKTKNIPGYDWKKELMEIILN